MTIQIVAVTLANHDLKVKGSIELSEGGTLFSFLEAVGLNANSPYVYSVNDKIVAANSIRNLRLKDSDVVKVIPIISGG